MWVYKEFTLQNCVLVYLPRQEDLQFERIVFRNYPKFLRLKGLLNYVNDAFFSVVQKAIEHAQTLI